MRELRIDGHSDHFHIAFLEFIQPMIESDQLGGTNEGKIQRVKKHHGVFAQYVFFQVKLFVEIVVAHHGNSVEIGGGFADEYSHVHLLKIGCVEWRNLDFCHRRVNLLLVVGFYFREGA
jgi:hypothetical protein